MSHLLEATASSRQRNTDQRGCSATWRESGHSTHFLAAAALVTAAATASLFVGQASKQRIDRLERGPGLTCRGVTHQQHESASQQALPQLGIDVPGGRKPRRIPPMPGPPPAGHR